MLGILQRSSITGRACICWQVCKYRIIANEICHGRGFNE